MPKESIKEILMRRDNLTEAEADELISKCKEDLLAGITRSSFLTDLMKVRCQKIFVQSILD